jgi:hypothetical protein
MLTILLGKNVTDAKHKAKKKIKPPQSILTITIINKTRDSKSIVHNHPTIIKVKIAENTNIKHLLIIKD